jgi:CubicO group peptidase (beta-lactamase class C family)
MAPGQTFLMADSFSLERDIISLANWRQSPYNRFSFHHVCEFIPTADVPSEHRPAAFTPNLIDAAWLASELDESDLSKTLEASSTDAFVVVRQNELIFEWRASHYQSAQPHILFSVSKSVTGLLVGILESQGLIDPAAAVADYLPEAKDAGYGHCTIQQVLDMQAEIVFIEDYHDQTGAFARYRSATGWNPPSTSVAEAEGLAEFLLSLKGTGSPHGQVFRYLSPNSDLLGIIAERATNHRFADLLSTHIWQPLGCANNAYITVDHKGAARSAGGLCVHPLDLALLGSAIGQAAAGEDHPVIPRNWINDTLSNGNINAWRSGEFANFLPDGNYRNQWYLNNAGSPTILAIGIHGQWLYIEPKSQTVIVKFSSEAQPVDEAADIELIEFFGRVCRVLA